MSEKQQPPEHRSRPVTAAFRSFIADGWAPRSGVLPEPAPSADYASRRRDAVSAAYPGERIVVPAGGLKVRSNDTDYVFRPHSAFAHLTGLGADREPDAVLVLEPDPDGGHEAILYFTPLAGRDTEEFFANSRVGEFWVGARPTLESMAAELRISTRDLAEFEDAVAKDVGAVTVRVVPDADREVTALVDKVRRSITATVQDQQGEQARDSSAEHQAVADTELARFLSTLRLVKDEWELEQMALACDDTAVAFDAVVSALPDAIERGRGERWIEGVFGLHARHRGNGVGYDSICAAGDHANTLHWIRNTGDVTDGDLVLIDAGVEVDSLYTADVTRTVPANGTFTDAQRRVYEVVLEAQHAGIEAARVGNTFSDIHAAAIRVIATRLHEWGLLPDGVSVEDTLDAETGQYHRRWMVHGTSHHLGIDVHDCALALRQDYLDAPLQQGMVLTVEPGLYFKADDQLVPEELRGIGVRIEDDIVITDGEPRNLSAALPRSVEEVQAWVRSGGVR